MAEVVSSVALDSATVIVGVDGVDGCGVEVVGGVGGVDGVDVGVDVVLLVVGGGVWCSCC